MWFCPNLCWVGHQTDGYFTVILFFTRWIGVSSCFFPTFSGKLIWLSHKVWRHYQAKQGQLWLLIVTPPATSGLGYWMFWDIGSLTNQGGQHHTRMHMIDFVYEIDPRIKNPIGVFAIRRYIAFKHGKTRCFITQRFPSHSNKINKSLTTNTPNVLWGPNVMWTLVSNHAMNTRALFTYHQHNNEFLQFCKQKKPGERFRVSYSYGPKYQLWLLFES